MIEVANIAGIPIAGTANVELIAPSGTVSATASLPINIATGNLGSYSLNTFDTSGYMAGVYTVTVNIVNGAGQPISDGSGYGLLSVGQAVKASVRLAEDVVPPGTAQINASILSQLVRTDAGGSINPTPTLTQTVVVSSVIHAGNNNPLIGQSVNLDAGTWDVWIEEGAYSLAPWLPWFNGINASVYYTDHHRKILHCWLWR